MNKTKCMGVSGDKTKYMGVSGKQDQVHGSEGWAASLGELPAWVSCQPG